MTLIEAQAKLAKGQLPILTESGFAIKRLIPSGELAGQWQIDRVPANIGKALERRGVKFAPEFTTAKIAHR